MKKNLAMAINAAIEAGAEILKVYESDFSVETKDDKSPLTLADKNAHIAIMKHLSSTPYPILSEEGKQDSYERRATWKLLWIVDPLDGTKEFVKRNGEFTVNIALVKNGFPVMGVIYIPLTNTLYYGLEDFGAYKVENINCDEKINSLNDLNDIAIKLPFNRIDTSYTVAISRTHMTPETNTYLEKLRGLHGSINTVSKGSSLKICMIAEGIANEYPRLSPTMEWDTAAGHAIVKAAGFNIYKLDTETELKYNKPNLLNPWFLVK